MEFSESHFRDHFAQFVDGKADDSLIGVAGEHSAVIERSLAFADILRRVVIAPVDLPVGFGIDDHVLGHHKQVAGILIDNGPVAREGHVNHVVVGRRYRDGGAVGGEVGHLNVEGDIHLFACLGQRHEVVGVEFRRGRAVLRAAEYRNGIEFVGLQAISVHFFRADHKLAFERPAHSVEFVEYLLEELFLRGELVDHIAQSNQGDVGLGHIHRCYPDGRRARGNVDLLESEFILDGRIDRVRSGFVVVRAARHEQAQRCKKQ